MIIDIDFVVKSSYWKYFWFYFRFSVINLWTCNCFWFIVFMSTCCIVRIIKLWSFNFFIWNKCFEYFELHQTFKYLSFRFCLIFISDLVQLDSKLLASLIFWIFIKWFKFGFTNINLWFKASKFWINTFSWWWASMNWRA